MIATDRGWHRKGELPVEIGSMSLEAFTGKSLPIRREGEHLARWGVIAAARRRGWSNGKIALALGVSSQRVAQILEQCELQFGEPKITGRPRKASVPKFAWKCAGCGGIQWRTKTHIRRYPFFCKRACKNKAFGFENVTESIVRSAIDMRAAGMTWKGIGKCHKLSWQAIQRGIWMYLLRENMLTVQMLRTIWNPRSASNPHYYAWNWLINSTGIVPAAA